MSATSGAAPQKSTVIFRNSDVIGSCLGDQEEIQNLNQEMKSAEARKAEAEKAHAATVKQYGPQSAEAARSQKNVAEKTQDLQALQERLEGLNRAFQGKCVSKKEPPKETKPKEVKKTKPEKKQNTESKKAAPKPTVKERLEELHEFKIESFHYPRGEMLFKLYEFESRGTIFKKSIRNFKSTDDLKQLLKKYLEESQKDPKMLEQLLEKLERPQGEMLLEAVPKLLQKPQPTPIPPKQPDVSAPKQAPAKPTPTKNP